MTVKSFQTRVVEWLIKCFGVEIAYDKTERNHRYLEESLELVQACGCTRSEAHQLVDYVFGRPAGDKHQEAGGVMVTLASLCNAQDIEMDAAGEIELERVHGKMEQIRAKQAAKPKRSPLPEKVEPGVEPTEAEALAACLGDDAALLLETYPDVPEEVIDNMRAAAVHIERRELLINTPQTEDWFAAVRLEAAHQQERWGTDHDEGKAGSDWFWLVGRLLGKALHAQSRDKILHHLITSSAAILNWHRHMTGEATRMRPGTGASEGHA